MKRSKGFLGKKFVLTAGCLLAVFALFLMGKDVRQLEIIVPAILGFYHVTNAYENQKAKKDNDNGN